MGAVRALNETGLFHPVCKGSVPKILKVLKGYVVSNGCCRGKKF